MELTPDEKALIEITQWPASKKAATADAMIVHGARLAVAFSAESHELLVKTNALDKASPERVPAFRLYMDAIVSMLAEAQMVDLLVQVQKRDREEADVLARRLWEMTEDGGIWTEFMWQYLDERGVDANALFTLAERQSHTDHTSSYCDKGSCCLERGHAGGCKQ